MTQTLVPRVCSVRGKYRHVTLSMAYNSLETQTLVCSVCSVCSIDRNMTFSMAYPTHSLDTLDTDSSVSKFSVCCIYRLITFVTRDHV